MSRLLCKHSHLISYLQCVLYLRAPVLTSCGSCQISALLPCQITRTADGYQPHLVSPERGLQLMASKALDQVEGPVQECVSQVYTLLVAAARDAAAVSGEHTEAAMNGKVPLNVPEFKTFIMPAVVRALDEWRTEGEKSECQEQLSSRTGRHGVWSCQFQS